MLCSYFLLSEKTWGRDSYIKAPFTHTFAGDRCKALRRQLQCFASETGKTGIEIVSPILDNRKGKKDSPYGPL